MTLELVSADTLGDSPWNAFCATAAGAWFYHGTDWRDYSLQWRSSLHGRSVSFALCDNTRILAAMPLLLEEFEDGSTRLGWAGDAAWAPGIDPELPRHRWGELIAAVLEHIDVLAAEYGARVAQVRLTPLARQFHEYLPRLLAAATRAGWTDSSLCSLVVDLTQSTSSLHNRMRKGHRSDIRRGRRILEVDVVAGADVTSPIVDSYREMHARAAGRVTRPPGTFALMGQWARQGNGALLRAHHGETVVGFAYLLLDGDGAYYASTANDPAVRELAVGHVLQACAIEWLKQSGYRRYELGLQQFGLLPHDRPSEKDLGIALFKRGFGGEIVPLVTRERVYSPAQALARASAG